MFAHFEASGAAAGYVVPALLPNLHIRLRGRSRYRFGNGDVRDGPRVALVGATSAAFAMEVSGDFEMLCAGFLPEGWHALFDGAAASFADDIVDAAAIWPAAGVDALWHALGEAGDIAPMQAVLEGFLTAQVHRATGGDDARIAVIRNWVEQPSPGVLADRLGVSRRHAGRLTHDVCGLGTKTLAMKYRALRVASALALVGESAMDEALVHYADQSHLIRDFHRFVGCTPCRFLREHRALACATIRGRWEAGVRAPMALLS